MQASRIPNTLAGQQHRKFTFWTPQAKEMQAVLFLKAGSLFLCCFSESIWAWTMYSSILIAHIRTTFRLTFTSTWTEDEKDFGSVEIVRIVDVSFKWYSDLMLSLERSQLFNLFPIFWKMPRFESSVPLLEYKLFQGCLQIDLKSIYFFFFFMFKAL
ncbi:hypothetical protein ACJIZ3_017654 [Penstemon smallii]|uniref:Uncharacterized protein n=1 Tax=Penstemon smallii TaxID=265156 RepID=A0ABD3SW79_9LAMI